MKKAFQYFIILLLISPIYNQTTNFNFSADIVSRYIWRGSEYGKFNNNHNSPHIQPTAAFSIILNNSTTLSLGFWGSYGFNGDYSENDLYLNAFIPTEIIDLSITLNDYYYPMYGINITNFDGEGKGAHTLEGNIVLTLKNIPLKFMISNNIHN
ncbi:MAG: hypothetical protein JNJ94_03045, partial [Chlorobi bacterium]|nr:hypothetical protein [Chlorobiota bacterium]